MLAVEKNTDKLDSLENLFLQSEKEVFNKNTT